MPIPAVAIPGLIGAGGQISGSIINAAAQSALNRKQQKFAREMYGRQRSDALEDWNRETSYNSPAEQMKRLRDAKLNPNLVYGNGVLQDAPSTRSSSAPSWNPKSPDLGGGLMGLGSALAMMYDIKLREAQTNNVMAATDVSAEEKLLKQAQTYATIFGLGKTDAETKLLMTQLGNAQSLSDISVEQARANVERTKAETDIALSANERAVIAQASSLKEAAMRILSMRMQNAKSEDERKEIQARISQIQTNTAIAQEDLKLKQHGIQPHDKLFQRKVMEVLQTGPKWDGRILPGNLDQKVKDAFRRGYGRSR